MDKTTGWELSAHQPILQRFDSFKYKLKWCKLNSVSEITAVKPVKGRDTEMYPIEFN